MRSPPRWMACLVGWTLCAVGSAGCGQRPPSNGCGVPGAVVSQGWVHVPEGSPIEYQHNPPASGPHYPVWLRYQVYDAALARGYWVHNLEHGGIVLAHRPDAPAAGIAALQQAYQDLPDDPACGHRRALVVPDPALPHAFAIIAADFTLEGECVDGPAIQRFVLEHRNHGTEDVCTDGQRP